MKNIKKKRMITYCEAINETLNQEMKRNKNVVAYGLEDKVFGSTKNLSKNFGSKRFFFTPLSEDLLTGMSLGLAISGKIPIFNHIRVDFLLLGMNQLINMISSYRFSTNGKSKVPILIRAVIGRGWGQGYQHSKSLQSIFSHIPGLKVIMPSTPKDVKGMLTSALRGNSPVICLEHRWLYWQKGYVPKNQYTIDLNKSNILKRGKDVSLICSSWMNIEALQAAKFLEKKGISCEIIDLRSISPLDKKTILNSVKKTKRCIIADYDWLPFGVASEVSHLINNNLFKKLKYKVERIGFKFIPCPTSRDLENNFYPNAKDIIDCMGKMFNKKFDTKNIDLYSHERKFFGPF